MNDESDGLLTAVCGTRELIVTNTGGWAAARVSALTPILAVHRVRAEQHRLYETYGPHTDRSGARRLRLSGPETTLDSLTQRIIPELLERMRTGLDSALDHSAGQRGSRSAAACPEADRNARRRQRREYGRRYFHAWGEVWVQRSRAALAGEPEARRDQTGDPFPDCGGDGASRARADVDDLGFWLFDDAIRLAKVDAGAELIGLQAGLRGEPTAGDLPARASGPAPSRRNRRRDRITFGSVSVSSEGRWRADVVIRTDGDRAAARSAALMPIIRALGGSLRVEEDNFGQFSGYIAGRQAVVDTLCRRLGPLLELAEHSATVAIRDRYGPSLEVRSSESQSWRQARRREWRQDYLVALGHAIADRLTSAMAGRPDAGRIRYRDERRGWQEQQEAHATARPRAEAGADVDRLDAQRFHALAIAVGRAPIESAEPAVTVIADTGAIERRSPGARIAVTDVRRLGAARLAALTHVAEAWQLKITADPYRPNCGSAVGHPRLVGVFSSQLRDLTAMLDAYASVALRRDRVTGRRPASDYGRRLNDCGSAYAIMLRARLNSGALAHPTRAEAEATGVTTAHIDEAALHIAGVTSPHLLGECANSTVNLVVAPGSFCSAGARTAVITAVAQACGLTATLMGYVDVGRSWAYVREAVRLDGPAPVVTAVTALIPGLLAAAEAALAMSLPECEAVLDSRASTAWNLRARDLRRDAWAAGVMNAFGACYARRLMAGVPVLWLTSPSRSGAGVSERRVACAAVDAIGSSEFAALSSAITAAWDRTRSAWFGNQRPSPGRSRGLWRSHAARR